MTNRDQFLELLGGLRAQWDQDVLQQRDLSKVYGVDSMPVHNIDLLAVPVVKVMSSLVAMDDEKAIEEINRYMYVLQYGTVKDADIQTSEELWSLLNTSAKDCKCVSCTCDSAPLNFEPDFKAVTRVKNWSKTMQSPSISDNPEMHFLRLKFVKWNCDWDDYNKGVVSEKPRTIDDFLQELRNEFIVTLRK